jgi:hypothetical protein
MQGRNQDPAGSTVWCFSLEDPRTSAAWLRRSGGDDGCLGGGGVWQPDEPRQDINLAGALSMNHNQTLVREI